MRAEEHPPWGANARPQAQGPCDLPTELGGSLRPQLGSVLWDSHGFDRFPGPRARGALVDVANSGAGDPRYLAPRRRQLDHGARGRGSSRSARRVLRAARRRPLRPASARAARWPPKWETSAAAVPKCAGQTFLGWPLGCCGALGPTLGGGPHRLSVKHSRRGRDSRVWAPWRAQLFETRCVCRGGPPCSLPRAAAAHAARGARDVRARAHASARRPARALALAGASATRAQSTANGFS